MKFRKSFGSGILSIALVTSMVVATPSSSLASTHLMPVSNQLAAAGASLAQASMLTELLPTIDGFGTNPALVLGLHEAFGDLTTLDGEADLETALEALGGAPGSGFTYDFISDNLVGDVRTVTFTLAASRSVDIPLMAMSDDVQIVGDDVQATVTLAPTTVTIELDESNPADPAAFAFTNLPTFSLSASLDVTLAGPTAIPVQFGFAEATAAGTLHLGFTADVSLIDPDGLDRLTGAELTTLAVEDFISLDFPDNGTDDLNLDIDLVADVFGTQFGGKLIINDENLFSGATPTVDLQPVGANPIDLLTNVGGDTAITSLAQLVSGYGLAMIAGDVDLPFLGDGVFIPEDLGIGDAADFDQVFDVIRPLMDYVTPRSSGQIVCGVTEGPDPDGAGGDDGLPAGGARNLEAGQAVFCRTYTSQNGDAAWSVNGAAVPFADSALTIGLDPTRNIELAAGPAGEFAVELEFTPDDGFGARTIKERPDTIQELLTELADAGLIEAPGGIPAFGYDSDLEAFTFDIGMTAPPITRDATVNVGNSLVADTGLTGLSGTVGAAAEVMIDNASAGITLGLIVTDDAADINPADNALPNSEPGPGDRFFVAASSPILEVGTVDMTGSIAMEGRLGFLEVGATANGTLSSPGAGPAVAVSLNTGTGVTIGTGPGAYTDPNAILIRDLLRSDPVSAVSVDIDLVFAGSVAVTSDAPGLMAGGGFDVTWDLNNAKPTIDNISTEFEQTLLPFTSSLELVQDVVANHDDPTLLTTSSTNLLTEPGLVGSQLVDTTGNVCNITAVLSSTELNCSAVEGSALNPITFTDGATYTVAGNTLSKLSEILAALDGLVAYLELAVGDDTFSQPIDLIGVSPADLVGQLDELRRMIDEFRGIQDAQITCSVQSDPSIDIRAIPVSAAVGGNIALDCSAVASSDSPSDVMWRLSDPSASTPGPFSAAPDDTVGPATPTPPAAFTLTLPAAYDTMPAGAPDGFISIGSEYTVEVEWNDANGGHQAAFPPRVPQSLQHLNDLIAEILGLPSGVLEFELVDVATDPTLRINLGYGICSDVAPDFDAPPNPCDGRPTGPTPEANLNLDLGSGLPFAGLETMGSLNVRYAMLGQFDVGIPLTGGSPVLYGTTNLEARVQVSGSSDFGVTASIGPVGATLGEAANGGTGVATDDSATTLTTDTGAFADVSVGMLVTNTATNAQCVITAITDADNVVCGSDGWSDDADFATGDPFIIGGANDLEGALKLEVQLTNGGAATTPTEAVPFASAGVSITTLDEFLAGNASCGRIDEDHMSQVTGDPVSADERDLEGIACAQLSLAAEIGGSTVYLGEIDVELAATANPFRVFVPTDMASRLEDALLDPAFLLRAFPDLLEFIENGMRDAADSGIPSAIGDPLRTGAEGIETLRGEIEGFIDPLADLLEGLTPGGDLEAEIAAQLATLLGIDAGDITVATTCGAAACTDTNTLIEITDVSASFNFGQMVEASTGVNLGLEGLPLSVEAGVQAFADWDLQLGVGVSRDDGPYVQLESGAEFSAGAGVALDAGASGCDAPMTDADIAGLPAYTTDRCIRAKLGFLQVEGLDNADTRSVIEARLGLDVTSDGADPNKLTLGDILAGDVTVTPVLAAGVNLDLHIRTGIEGATEDLPTILGTFALNWSIGDLGDIEDDSDDVLVAIEGVTIPTPTVAFDNLHLDLGSVLSGFLKPIADEVKKITGPLQPIIDVITAPIPVVSDLAELVGGAPITMISILEEVSDADLSLIEAVAAFITFFNSIPTDSGLLIPLGNPGVGGEREPGGFNVNAVEASIKVSHTEAGKLIDQGAGYKGGTGFTNDVGKAGGDKLNNLNSPDPDRPATFGVPGLTFPFLEDASQIFGILVGRDAVLIRWDAGTLRASAGMSYDFGPIMVGPIPITITIGGEIGIEGRFAIGYDTSGIRKLLDGGSGTALFDGIFIDDLDANGNDVPEIKFFGRVYAGAAVDLVIVSAGVRGGIELTFTLDLDDRPDPDGKLRIEEIVDKLQNPICLFEVGGKIEAFLEAYVEIDLFFYSEEFSFELVRITLLEWSSACEPPAPDLVDEGSDAGVLYLHIGSRRSERNIQVDEIDERIEIRQLAPGKVRVSAYGWEEVHTGVELIVADGGIGDDEIIFLPGSSDETDPVTGELSTADVPFDIPVVVSGGAGNDTIKTGDAADLIYGDTRISGGGEWEGVTYSKGYAADPAPGDEPELADPGNDLVNAGMGDDVVKSNAGDDNVEGEEGADTIEGGPDNDSLNGGPGGDAVLGQGGIDSVHGGPIAQPDPGDTDIEIDDNDALSGGGGSDTVSGDFGSDVMFGDDPVAGFLDADSAMRRTGFSLPSATTWRGWCDAVATGDADIMVGNAGNDFMVGGGGDDQMDGNEGDDYVCGSDGADEVVGDVGDDELRGNGDDDVLQGNDGHDLIYGGSGNDIANGNDDNDDIFGDGGSDLLYGDDGDDIVVGDTGSVATHDSIADHGVDGASIDEARVLAIHAAVTRDSSTSNARRSDCDFASSTGDSDCIFGGSGSDALFGGSDGDIIQGQAGSDLIEGNHGPDELRGGTDEDLLFGNEDGDDMFGDGADDAMYGDRDIPAWVLNDPTGAAVDTMNGGPGADHMEGDGGNDVMFGGADPDHMEGNNGDDTMYGESGSDDMIGGSDNNDAEPDTGETLMSGGLGNDVMTGDNAEILPGGYVGERAVTLHDPIIGGADHMEGDDETDYMFGQVGGDEMWGDQGVNGPDLGVGKADYMEGNDGDDTMNGEAGNDDMVGGNSATNGAIIEFRIGTNAADVGETLMSGGPGNDWMAGDNARMNRVLKGLGADALDLDPIKLFDLAGVGNPAVLGSAHGGDTMNGDGGTDFMFGQGSNDTMSGGDLPDYMEGNDGNDTMAGNDGDDDMIGGGSALDGIMDRIRVGEGLHDEGETNMSGGDGTDWMAGDNAFMNRVLFGEFDTPIDLFDVNSSDEALVSGGDTMEGNDGEDIMFGQGNGSQSNQSDPPDGVDNDGDGATDEDAAWDGDTMSGGADDDYIEGNHGSDLIYGNGGNDDLIGGGSALDGLFIELRVGNGLQDERDTVYGNDGQDVVAGDNARINRTGELTGLILPAGEDRSVTLFDVDSGSSTFSGGDFLSGGADDDLVFGQGNGTQSADQADPLDGVDNDFDGREGPDSTEYDCADNGFDNDGDGDADAADAGCNGADVVDEDQPWDGDIMLGNGGDDYMEGNHGADWMFGGADEDDMIGGGSAADGIIVPTRDGTGLNDGPDVMQGEGEDDVMAGDNAWINRIANGAGTDWVRISTADVDGTPTAGYGPYDQAVRVTNMHAGDAGAEAHGNDYMTGGDANDEMYGQLGDDFVLGNLGDDALVGDLGQVRANVIGDDPSDPDPETIATQSPRWEDTIYELGSMWWETELYAYDTSAGGVGGADTLLGYDGRDTAFGGPGDDVINGDGDGVEEVFDADNPEFTHITDVDGDDDNNDDTDMLFGGDDNDAIWGGRHNDVLLGGHGADFLDVRPREETDNGRTGAKFRMIPRDRPAWFTWAFPENFQGVDFIYGGWDEDALQADQAANGPDPGDRLADWAGGYNVFYLCPAGYGDFTITRSGSPFVQRFIQDLAEASGAFDAASNGESGFRDVGFVFPNQRGQNSHPPHPDHPGHFTCADYTGVGSGLAVANIAGADSVPEGGSASLDGTASSGYGSVAFDWSVNPFDVDDAGSAAPTINAAGLDDGSVDIGLEVIDGDGSYGLAKTSIEVTNVAPAVALNTMTTTVDDGSAASIETGYTDPGVLDTHTAVIDWGDGSVCDTAVNSECSILGAEGSGVIAGTHTYAGLGSYVVSVTVTDDDGGATTEELGTVEVVPPRVRAANTWITTDPWPADPLAVAGVDYGRDEAIGVMESGAKNERSGSLFRQLAAALLNAAHGADTSCVDDVVAAADGWLTANPPGSGVKDNSAAWAEAEALWTTLRDYNTGALCVPAP